MKLLKKINKGLPCLLALVCFDAFASQIKVASDGSEIAGKISIRDVNRISLIGDRVKSTRTSMWGYEFSNDTDSGDIYVKSLPDNIGDPLNAFIITEKGYTYKLLLTPSDVPSEQIFIRNPEISNDKAEGGLKVSYEQEVIEIMKAMRSGSNLKGFKIITVRKRESLLDDLSATRRVEYISSKYSGLVYEIRNKTKEAMTLSEGQFNRRGVKAVSLSSSSLKAGERATVYIVEISS